MNAAAIQQFADALKEFKRHKNMSSTKTLLDATERLQAVFPEAREPLAILISNLQMRMAKFAAQEAFQQPQPPQIDQGEGVTDFTQTLLSPDQTSTFAEIIGYAEVKQRICNLILEPLVDPLWKKGGVRTGVVLYGPGGTGKSLLAKALAGESKKPVFFVTEGNIQSKFVGGSQRNMKALLDTAAVYAKRHGGCIIFFDEGDTLFGTESIYGQGVVNEFKSRHDLINKLNIATIVATNHPASLRDTGLKRRLGQGIYMGMPRVEDNKEKVTKGRCLGNVINIGENDMYDIIKFYMKKTGVGGAEPNFTLSQFRDMLRKFPKLKLLTGDNLRALVERAEGLNPLGRDHYRELFYCPTKDGKLQPLLTETSKECRKYDKNWTAADIERIQWPPVDVESIRSVLESGIIVPTTTPDDIREYLKYAEFLPDELSVARIQDDLKKFDKEKPKSEDTTPVVEKKEPPKPKWFGIY